MIRLFNAWRLASAKIRARKATTLVTVVLASLLFSVLISASLIVNGLLRSVDDIQEGSLTDRYLVGVSSSSIFSSMSFLEDPELVKEAKQIFDKLIAEKTAEAKRLGLNYSSLLEDSPIRKKTQNEESLGFRDANGIVEQVLAKKFAGRGAIDVDKLREIAKTYDANVFNIQTGGFRESNYLMVLPEGGEIFYNESDPDEVQKYRLREASLIDSTSFDVYPESIIRQFMLTNQAGWTAESQALPVMLHQNDVEKLLKLKPLDDSSSAQERLDRLELIRERASNLTYQACYRNRSSTALIQEAIRQRDYMALNKGKEDYVEPKLIYELPDPNLCQAPLVVKDTRSSAEKRHDENQKIFDTKFNNYSEPVNYFMNFKVVGILPAKRGTQHHDPESSLRINNFEDLFRNLLKIDGFYSPVIPQELLEQMGDRSAFAPLLDIKENYSLGYKNDGKYQILEFPSANLAEKFMSEQTCDVGTYDFNCLPAGRDYQARYLFSNSLAIKDVKEKIALWFSYALLGVAGLAVIILWIAISRTITTSRRETAIFRAIGFRRFDIAVVYISYVAIILLFVVLLSAGLAVAGAYFVNQHFALGLTAELQYGFGGFDLSKTVNLIGIDKLQLLMILAVLLVAGALSTFLLLPRNVRRNPVGDMREE